jgi:hypothetical protein
MSKFWTVVTILLITGIVLLAVDRQQTDGIKFTELETECRYDTANMSSVGLDSNRITFSGYFQTNSPEANLDYRYSISDSNIELDIITRDSIIPESFQNTCLASVVYEAETQRLEEGDYTVSVYHEGVRKEKSVIRVK